MKAYTITPAQPSSLTALAPAPYEVHRFASLGALAAQAQKELDKLDIEDNRADTASTDEYGYDYGDMSINDAIETAASGGQWASGAGRLKDIAKTIDVSPNAPRAFITSDVQGSSVNTARYLSGHPRNMYKRKKANAPKKAIKLAVNIGGIPAAKSEHHFNRGAATLALVQELEQSGHKVELWACARVSADYAKESGHSVDVLLKPANKKLCAEDLAFSLCHPAMQRRLAWLLREISEKARALTKGSYGLSGKKKAADWQDYDAFTPSLDSTYLNHCASSATQALDYLRTNIEKQLNN